MAYGIALKMRAIQPHSAVVLFDEGFMTNRETGQVYIHNRAYRRVDNALGSRSSKHKMQKRFAYGYWQARKDRRTAAKISRRNTY